MTERSERQRLQLAIEDAWRAVGELVLIALEDQPADGSLVAADDLAEQVSELEGELASARAALSAQPSAIEFLPDVLTGTSAAVWRYWGRLRAHRPVMQLRLAARRLGGPWPAWQRSVEQTALRCEAPLAAVAAATQACLRELCEAAAPPCDPSRLDVRPDDTSAAPPTRNAQHWRTS